MLFVADASQDVDHANLNGNEWAGIKTMMGEHLAGRIPVTTLVVKGKKPVPDYFQSIMPVVSNGVRDVLIAHHAEVEFFDVTLKYIAHIAHRPVNERYFFMNPLRIMDWVDETKSTITRRLPRGSVETIDKLVLTDAADVNPAPLLRLRGYEWIVCVSEPVKIALEARSCTGIKFSKVSEFKFPSFG